jgi:hypothetical protein
VQVSFFQDKAGENEETASIPTTQKIKNTVLKKPETK